VTRLARHVLDFDGRLCVADSGLVAGGSIALLRFGAPKPVNLVSRLWIWIKDTILMPRVAAVIPNTAGVGAIGHLGESEMERMR
jgi:hypothetical protein